MPRIDKPRVLQNARTRILAERAKTIAKGKSPEEVYETLSPRVTSPVEHVRKLFPRYRFDPEAVDIVMKKHGIGDVVALMKTAIALDNGNRFLSVEELEQAAESLSPHRSYKFNSSTLADVMTQKGVAEQSALLHAAQSLDDGDRYLSRDELERAADVLLNVVAPNDVAHLLERTRECALAMGAELKTLGHVEGLPILAVTKRAKNQPPKLRVFVSGGVHGNEPCGAAAAVLLLEQLKSNPQLADDVEFVVLPAVNPRALAAGTRRTPEDIDMNRTMVSDHARDPKETHLLRDFLEKNKCDLCLDLHSGKAARNGFWVLHRNSEDVAEPAMKRFAERWPVLQGDTKPYTMSAPGVAVSKSSETVKDLASHLGARWSYTVEAPGSVSYLDQVLGENEIVHEFIQEAFAKLSSAPTRG